MSREQTATPPLGIPSTNVPPLLQTDGFKELVNKLAWAMGSTYRVPYANSRTPARALAIRVASHLIDTQGYPAHLEGV